MEEIAMKTLGYYNGKFGELDEMTVPMNDRVCWFGDGVYDAGPARNYKIFAIDEHIDRFFNSAGLLDMKMPVTKQELKDLLQEMVNKMDTGNLFVYYQLTRGTGIRNHVFTEGPGNLWIMLKPAEISDGMKPIKLISTEDTRFFHCNIKTLNLIPSVMAAEKAKKAGADETVFYRPGGRVTECAHSNCHIIKDGKLITAPTDNLILPGIARLPEAVTVSRPSRNTATPVRWIIFPRRAARSSKCWKAKPCRPWPLLRRVRHREPVILP